MTSRRIFQLATGNGRGWHLLATKTPPFRAVCGRPVRPIEQTATAKTPYLCAQCALIAFGTQRQAV